MSPEEIARLPYRPCVGIMLIDRGGRVFVAQRINAPGEAWQMPQGGIDEGESPRRAALRELHEEIGTDKAEVLAESRNWWRYDLPAELVPRRWGGRYRAQMLCGVDLGNNVASDPDFCGIPGSSNYFLQSDSPCAPAQSACVVLIGAWDVNCGSVATHQRTWGGMKAMFE